MKRGIVKATLIAGTLDILAAFAHSYIFHKIPPDIVLKYIASGVFGKAAYSGTAIYPLAGLVFHFAIVLTCAVVYFCLYPRMKCLQRSIFVSALLIALVAWVITTQVVIRVSKITPAPFELNSAFMAIAILWVCLGLPLAFFAKQCYGQYKLDGIKKRVDYH